MSVIKSIFISGILLFLSAAPAVTDQLGSTGCIVTTFAGSGVKGSADGTGAGASFNSPYGIAVDKSGNVYVADTINNSIRKIGSAGAVTTLAGSGSPGSADGAGTAASFNGPSGIAVDKSGNVYVADQRNNLIRMISPAGAVTTLAGSGSAGSANGTGKAASFNGPNGVAVDDDGVVYVADFGNNLIRKITSAGVVTTLAGSGSVGSDDGTGTAASFKYPNGVAVDGSGNVYVADFGNDRIRKITSAGVVTTLAGSGAAGSADGTGSAASFYSPDGVAVGGSGNVYVADTDNNSIRKITPAGAVTTLAGRSGRGSANGLGTAASFYAPAGVAVDSSGDVYVVDTDNNLIRKITSAGAVATLAGSGVPGSANGTGTAASFNGSAAVAVDASGNVYEADRNNNVIRKIASSGTVTTFAGSGSSGSVDGVGSAASFNGPTGLAVDGSGNVYVADFGNNLIRKISSAGVVTTLAGSGFAGSANGIGVPALPKGPKGGSGSAGATGGSGPAASFNGPAGVAVDGSGNVYVTDQRNNMIRKISPAGVVTTLAGSGAPGSSNGSGTSATFNGPTGVAVDASGNVYVADTDNDSIRRISPIGAVTTLAGSAVPGSSNGIGTAASFNGPAAVAVDGSGNVYVADQRNNSIRKITPLGEVTNLEVTGSSGSANGTGAAAALNGPAGIAVDRSGIVYVADFGNNLIWKVVPEGVLQL